MSRCHRCGFICCVCWMLGLIGLMLCGCASPKPEVRSLMAEGRSQMAETANENQSSQMLLPSLPRAARSSAGSEIEHVARAVSAPARPLPPDAVRLEIVPSPDPSVTGYYIYRGGPNMWQRYHVSPLALTVVISNLPPGTNVFTARSVDAAETESYDSNSVEWFVPDVRRLEFAPYIFRAQWDGSDGVLQRSTNLMTWEDYAPLPSGSVVLVTNTGPREFFRVKLN